MDRKISRRDFVNGAVGSVVAGAALLPGCDGVPDTAAPAALRTTGMAGRPHEAAEYPPARLGSRGSHPGSFEVAHEMAFEKRTAWGAAAEPDGATYDLVVVGAGISGLAAAVFYREQHPGARVLLLENHDDFGGHAKRNEMAWGERTILGYGGSQSLEEPGAYSEVARGLLERIGVETGALRAGYDEGFYERHGLAAGVFFDRATYGVDRFVPTPIMDLDAFLPMARGNLSDEEAIARMPISARAKTEFTRLVRGSEDRLPEQSLFAEPGFLESISYRDFLTEHLGVREPEVLGILQDVPSGYWGHGIDVVPALGALGMGMPGLGSTSLGTFEGVLRSAIKLATEPYYYHFPDGNASVARLLVKRLIPAVAEGAGMDEIVTASFDYSALDRADAPVRLRLGSTVVRVAHEGAPERAGEVGITYVRGGRTEHVRARRAVLACYNSAIPYLCPEMPARQLEALGQLVKIPLVYTTVLVRQLAFCERAGLGFAHCPGSWHKMTMVDFPVSLGDYAFTQQSEDPVVLHMSSAIVRGGGTPQEQSRAGRFELLTTPFEAIEREIRTHLGGMLAAGGFDPARDIEAITVNRWPHGYAFEQNPLFDAEVAEGEAPHEIGRAPFGRITIANCDAGARAYLDCAIDEAWRAVNELPA